MNAKEKKTVVIGASPNPQRFSHAAVKKLKKYRHPVEAIGCATVLLMMLRSGPIHRSLRMFTR